MSFEREDNWADAADYLLARPKWNGVPKDARPMVFGAHVGNQHWQIRMNDFPDEPSFTLLVDSCEVVHFNDWPSDWGDRPAFVE